MAAKSPLTRNPKLEQVEYGLDLVANGLKILEDYQVFIRELGGKNGVDVAARINMTSGCLDKLVEPLKAAIKTTALASSNQSTINSDGNRYRAVITRSEREVTDNDALAKLLARIKASIPKKKQQIVAVAFEVKP